MRRTQWMKFIALAVLFSAGAIFYRGVDARQRQEPKHPPVPTDGKEMVVQLCDGETSTKVKGVSPDGRLTPEQAQAVSNELMRMWMDKVDPAKAGAWMKEQSAAQSAQPQTKAPAQSPSGSKSQPA
jgi:hypothetical protein